MSTSSQGRGPRPIVLCFDGTSSEYDEDNTNVVRFFSLLKKDNFNEQPCYYQAGIGTFFNPGAISPVFEWAAKVLDQAFAWYLDQHVMDGYRFLMRNYCVGDKICIFGYSRGAYTGRALAGMLYKIGLLPKDNEEQIPFAFKLYKREDKQGIELAQGFKRTYCQDVKIEFMGLWDTVSSVGVVMGRSLPFTNSNRAIKTFRHALSLDERRAKFRANVYHRPTPSNSAAERDLEDASYPENGNGRVSEDKENLMSRRRLSLLRGKSPSPSKMERLSFADYSDNDKDTDVLEVWFAGCHGDIGGGAVPNETRSSLSNITLRWMVKQVVESQCGIMFNQASLLQLSLGFISPVISDLSTKPKEEDIVDVMQPMHDALVSNKLWWLLEIIPLTYSWQDSKGVWHKTFRWHLGRGRKITDEQPKLHSSVRARMANQELAYKPKATWKDGTEVYVD